VVPVVKPRGGCLDSADTATDPLTTPLGARVPSPHPRLTWLASGRTPYVGLAAATVVLAAAGRADAWFLAACLVVARLLSRRRHTVLSNLPAAVLVVASAVMALLTVAGLLELPVLASVLQTRAVLLTASVALVVVTLRTQWEAGCRFAERRELLACAPAAVLLAVGAWSARRPVDGAVNAFLVGWDNGAHVLASAEIGRSGSLSYTDSPYPRGVHALVALVVSARGPLEVTPQLLESFLRTHAALVWLLYALLSATVALTALRLNESRGIAPRTATVSALTAGLATLAPGFFRYTFFFGFLTTLAVAVILAVVSLEMVSRQSPDRSFVLLAAAVAATAHTYQLALPALSAPFLVGAALLLRDKRSHRRSSVILSAPLLLLALPPAWSVVQNVGVETVADGATADAIAPLLSFWLATGAVAVLYVLHRPPVRGARTVAGMVVLCWMAALVTSWSAGTPVTAHYPAKLLWHSSLLAVPLVIHVATRALNRLHSAARRTPFVRLLPTAVTTVGLVMAVAFAVPAPYMAASGGWDAPGDPASVLMRPQDRAATCELDSEYARKIAFRLLYFYRDSPNPPPPEVGLLPVCQHAPTRP
jgi:hypothetical protein